MLQSPKASNCWICASACNIWNWSCTGYMLDFFKIRFMKYLLWFLQCVAAQNPTKPKKFTFQNSFLPKIVFFLEVLRFECQNFNPAQLYWTPETLHFLSVHFFNTKSKILRNYHFPAGKYVFLKAKMFTTICIHRYVYLWVLPQRQMLFTLGIIQSLIKVLYNILGADMRA